MPERKHKFLGILMVELEDLRSDIMELVAKMAEERESQKISSYTYRENVVALENEINGIKAAEAELGTISEDSRPDLDSLIVLINERLEQVFKKKAINRAAYVIIQRKVQKVKGYVTKDLAPGKG